MYCYRQGISYGWINTNNYIESWQNTLKKHFFRDKQQRRVDTVVFILVSKAIPHYQQMCIRHSVQVGRMTPGRKKAEKARQLAMEFINQKRLDDPEIVLLHSTSLDSMLKVGSFTNSNTYYDIEVDWSKGVAGQFNSCSCVDFFNNKMCCKHIALANLELPFTKFHYGGHWEKRSDIPLEEIVLDDVSSLPASNELASSVSTSLPTWDIIEHYLADLSNLLNMVDKESLFLTRAKLSIV